MRDPQAYADVVVLAIKSALAPVLERLAATEAQLKALGDVRDRVVAVETKAAMPAQPDAALGELREKVVALTQDVDKDASRLEGYSAALQRDLHTLIERVAVVETRASVQGPAGKDGQDGKSGADGLGFEDLVAVQHDDRSFTIKAARGDRVKEIGTAKFPVLIQRGVHVDGKPYELGDVVTWAGSQWHCNEDTVTKPGDGSKAWTLIVKRGRDGKDGRDGHDLVPVVKVACAGGTGSGSSGAGGGR